MVITAENINEPQIEALRSFVREDREPTLLGTGLEVILGNVGKGISARRLAAQPKLSPLRAQLYEAQRARGCAPSFEGDSIDAPLQVRADIAETFNTAALHSTCVDGCPFAVSGTARTKCSKAVGNANLILNRLEEDASKTYEIEIVPRSPGAIDAWERSQVALARKLGIGYADLFAYEDLESPVVQRNFVDYLCIILDSHGVTTNNIAKLKVNEFASGIYYSHLLCNFTLKDGSIREFVVTTQPGESDTLLARKLTEDFRALQTSADVIKKAGAQVRNFVDVCRPIGMGAIIKDDVEYPFYVSERMAALQLGVLMKDGKPTMQVINPSRTSQYGEFGSDFSNLLLAEAVVYLASNGQTAVVPEFNAGDWMVRLGSDGNISQYILMTFRAGTRRVNETQWLAAMNEKVNRAISIYSQDGAPYMPYSSENSALSPEDALNQAKKMLGQATESDDLLAKGARTIKSIVSVVGKFLH